MFLKWIRKIKAEALSFADDNLLDLGTSGCVNSMYVQVRAKNASALQNAGLQRISDHFGTTEILCNTDKRPKELNWRLARALNFYDHKRVPPEQSILYGNKTQQSSFFFNFGEFFGDTRYGLDLSKWESVELNLKNDITTSYFQTGEVKADVWLYMFEGEYTTPPTYLKSWEYSAGKPAADATYIRRDLPTTDRIRRVMVQLDPDLTASTGAVTADPVSDSYHLTMTLKNEGIYLYNQVRPKDFFMLDAARYGPAIVPMRISPSASIYADLQCGYVRAIGDQWVNDGTAAASDYLEWEDENGRYQKMSGVAGCNILGAVVFGEGYLTTFMLPFDLEGDKAKWLDPAVQGTVNLTWYGYKDDHTFRPVLEVEKAQGTA
jgi:hypothetical protein